jgi:hypothetical protein
LVLPIFTDTPYHLFLCYQRLIRSTEFAYGKVDPHDAGKQGGHSSGGTGSSESESTGRSGNSGGSAKGGQYLAKITHDVLVLISNPCAEFAHGKVDPHEAGKKGGRSS